MIYVVGCPSGGTSAVAGVLATLGVRMGASVQSNRDVESKRRKCDDGAQASWWHNTHECPLMCGLADEYWQINTPFLGWNHIRAKSVIDTYKRARIAEEGPIGVKDIRLGALLCDAGVGVNDTIVIVDRSVESSYRSWVRRNERLGTKQQFDHAGFVAQCIWFKDHLASNKQCYRVCYEEMLDDPADTAMFLALALELDEGKVSEAADTIRNYKGESFA